MRSPGYYAEHSWPSDARLWPLGAIDKQRPSNVGATAQTIGGDSSWRIERKRKSRAGGGVADSSATPAVLRYAGANGVSPVRVAPNNGSRPKASQSLGGAASAARPAAGA